MQREKRFETPTRQEPIKQGRNSGQLFRSSWTSSARYVTPAKVFWLIRSLIDRTFAVFIVCGPLQVVTHSF